MTCTSICTSKYAPTSQSTFTSACSSTCTTTCISTSDEPYIYVPVHVNLHVHLNVHLHVHLRVYPHAPYIHMYLTSTHTYTSTRTVETSKRPSCPARLKSWLLKGICCSKTKNDIWPFSSLMCQQQHCTYSYFMSSDVAFRKGLL